MAVSAAATAAEAAAAGGGGDVDGGGGGGGGGGSGGGDAGGCAFFRECSPSALSDDRHITLAKCASLQLLSRKLFNPQFFTDIFSIKQFVFLFKIYFRIFF